MIAEFSIFEGAKELILFFFQDDISIAFDFVFRFKLDENDTAPRSKRKKKTDDERMCKSPPESDDDGIFNLGYNENCSFSNSEDESEEGDGIETDSSDNENEDLGEIDGKKGTVKKIEDGPYI